MADIFFVIIYKNIAYVNMIMIMNNPVKKKYSFIVLSWSLKAHGYHWLNFS